MSRRIQNIRELLLKSGEEQFLKHGFEQASLRTICRQAGLTTGAFYNQFSGKEDLFSALVDPLLSGFQDVIPQEWADLFTDPDRELAFIKYVIAHQNEFCLLLECSKGTKYEGFKEYLFNEVFYPGYQELFDSCAGRQVDPVLVCMILRMKFEEYKELIYGGYTEEEAEKLFTCLNIFTEAGFQRLIEELKRDIRSNG